MTKLGSLLIALALAAACSASESSPPGTADAGVLPHPDAPTPAPAIRGLGQPCGGNLPECPDGLRCPFELEDPAHSYCTGLCAIGDFTTDADGAPIDFPDPSTHDSVCAGLYRAGPPGKPVCAAPHFLSPPAPLQPNTSYTLDFFCTIECSDTRQCPAGLQCNPDGDCTP